MTSTPLEIQVTVNLWTQDDGYMKGQLTFFCQPCTPLVNSPALVHLPQEKIWQNAQIHLQQTLVVGVTQSKAQKTIRRTSNWDVCSSHLRPRWTLDVSDPQIGFRPEKLWGKTSPLANSFGLEPHKPLVTTVPSWIQCTACDSHRRRRMARSTAIDVLHDD